MPEWVPYKGIGELPAVGDLLVLLGRVHAMRRGDPPFSARSYYDRDEKLVLEFAR
jgi:hypothetical protein